MHDPRLDLSLLDPSSREQEWAALVASVAERAWAAHQRRASVPVLLVRWARPWLALAAAAVFLVWGVALQQSDTSPLQAVAVDVSAQDATLEMAAWASQGRLPETRRLLALWEEMDEND